ncbi:DNA-binding transcriptional regulator [Parelusimicrobium proximum]|uniref:TetR/AcrR family transcriptional regulator n=1 Tax=Parelusimicrobium proximum TaxID=3228953 RepID=UPI003D17B69D
MVRKSDGSYNKLIKAGLALAGKGGINGFTVRELCARAGVNLGMFHYHFSNREQFSESLLSHLYEGMISEVKHLNLPDSSPKDNIREVLKTISLFVYKNRIILSSLVGDVFSAEERIMEFLFSNFREHIAIISKEFDRARKAGQIIDMDNTNLLLTIFPPLALPAVLLGLAERVSSRKLAGIKKMIPENKWIENTQIRMSFLLDSVFKERK